MVKMALPTETSLRHVLLTINESWGIYFASLHYLILDMSNNFIIKLLPDLTTLELEFEGQFFLNPRKSQII